MWKIVSTDNYDRESRAEYLIAENFRSKDEANVCCAALQNAWGRNSEAWPVVRPQAYVLWRGMAEFVDDEAEPIIDPSMT